MVEALGNSILRWMSDRTPWKSAIAPSQSSDAAARFLRKESELYVGNAGTAARFLTALVCLGHGEYTIRGDERMHERPMGELFQALRRWGVEIEADDDRLPAVVHAEHLRPRPITISTDDSTQFASALLLIEQAARAKGCICSKAFPMNMGIFDDRPLAETVRP